MEEPSTGDYIRAYFMERRAERLEKERKAEQQLWRIFKFIVLWRILDAPMHYLWNGDLFHR